MTLDESALAQFLGGDGHSNSDIRKEALDERGVVGKSLNKLQITKAVVTLATAVVPLVLGVILAYIQWTTPDDKDKAAVLGQILAWTIGANFVAMLFVLVSWYLDSDSRAFVSLFRKAAADLDTANSSLARGREATRAVIYEAESLVEYWNERHALLAKYWLELDAHLLSRVDPLPPMTSEEVSRFLSAMVQAFSEKLSRFYDALEGEEAWYLAVYEWRAENDGLVLVVAKARNESELTGSQRVWRRGEGHVGLAFQRFERGATLYHIPDAGIEAVSDLITGFGENHDPKDPERFKNVVSVPIPGRNSSGVRGLIMLACNETDRFDRNDFEPLNDLARLAAYVLAAPRKESEKEL